MAIGAAIAGAVGNVAGLIGRIIPERHSVRPGYQVIQERAEARQTQTLVIVAIIALILIVWMLRQ